MMPNNYHKEPCKDVRARVIDAQTRDEMCARTFTTRVHATLHGYL